MGSSDYERCLEDEKTRIEEEEQEIAQGTVDRSILEKTEANFKIDRNTFPTERVLRAGDNQALQYTMNLEIENPREQLLGISLSCNFSKDDDSESFLGEILPTAEFDFVEMKILPAKPMLNDSVTVKFVLKVNEDDFEGLQIAFDLVSSKKVVIFGTGESFKKKADGIIEVECTIPADFMNTGVYYIDIHISTLSFRRIYSLEQILSFEVFEDKRDNAYMGTIKGLIRPNVTWNDL